MKVAPTKLLFACVSRLEGLLRRVADSLAVLLHRRASLLREVAQRTACLFDLRGRLLRVVLQAAAGLRYAVSYLLDILVELLVFRQGGADGIDALAQHTAHVLATHGRDQQTNADSDQKSSCKTTHNLTHPFYVLHKVSTK